MQTLQGQIGWMKPMLHGIEVVSSEHAVERRWMFPTHRFFEWEPKDEVTCRRLGIGEEKLMPAAFMICGVLVVHPDLLDDIKNMCNRN